VVFVAWSTRSREDLQFNKRNFTNPTYRGNSTISCNSPSPTQQTNNVRRFLMITKLWKRVPSSLLKVGVLRIQPRQDKARQSSYRPLVICDWLDPRRFMNNY
jgi:hypothetical protein